jgi:hypothetical protein
MNRIFGLLLTLALSSFVHAEALSVIQAIPHGEVAGVDQITSIQE